MGDLEERLLWLREGLVNGGEIKMLTWDIFRVRETPEGRGMHRFEFQRRGLGVEEICPSPSHRTFAMGIGVCHETRMRNPGKFQLFHMMWVFRDSALGLRFWSVCVGLPCLLGSVLRSIMPLGELKGDHRSKTYCSASSQRCHFSGPWMLELWVIHGRILVYIRDRGHWILSHIKEMLKDLSESIKVLKMIDS